MLDYCLWLIVITLVQLSLIYLWFDSQLFSPLFNWCLNQDRTKWHRWFIFTLLTCPQCLGFWFSWACTAAGLLIPGCPIVGSIGYKVWMVFFSGLAVAVLSRLIDGLMPEPVNQKLIIYPDSLNTGGVSDTVDSDTEEQITEG